MKWFHFVYANPTGEICYSKFQVLNENDAWNKWRSINDGTMSTVLIVFTGEVEEVLYQQY